MICFQGKKWSCITNKTKRKRENKIKRTEILKNGNIERKFPGLKNYDQVNETGEERVGEKENSDKEVKLKKKNTS